MELLLEKNKCNLTKKTHGFNAKDNPIFNGLVNFSKYNKTFMHAHTDEINNN